MFNLDDYVVPAIIKVKVIKKATKDDNQILEKDITVYKYDYPDTFDFYEKIALKLGWKQDMDALWFLSQKGIEKIEKI